VSGARILVVDDEPDITALVAYHLARAGYRVSTAANGTDALTAIDAERPALVVLDLMLPGVSGYEVIEQLRARPDTVELPVLMLTARREEADRVHGLTLGADDYLTKPFSPQELVLRVGAILRRAHSTMRSADVVSIGTLRVERDTHLVTVDGAPVDLTPTEYKLLLTLMERRGRVQPRARLLETVWDAASDVQTRTVDMHVQRLRAKLGSAGALIETIRGFGYRMRANATPTESP
jgi:two-component system phosphate regulon response regulator PhoB